ncbi:MAG: DUF2520 domain-containing protein [Deltaproteobacteria bacterium]|nr:MAG: DUF2520 domain-containing protein [Deltaproteobacteria bacterium]
MIETAAVLGGGAVARALLRALPLSGVRVLASWHRRSGLEPPPLRDVDVVLLAVSDQAVSEVCGRLEVGPGQLVAHLAGALGLSPLAAARRKGARTGSLHPLRPFRGADGDVLEGFAAGISGSDPSAAADLAQLAVRLGMTPLLTRDRSGAQVALFSEATRAFRKATGLPEPQARAALLPLALGALEKLRREPPEAAITGPALRGDEATIAAHRKALSADLLALYDQLTAVALRLRKPLEPKLLAPARESRSSHRRRRPLRAARPSASSPRQAPHDRRRGRRRRGPAPRRPR